MDPNNPVVALCTQGMRAEVEGRPDDARAAFDRAWQAATDDYEACIAAHYIARHQTTAAQTLHWNAECLARADLVGDERVQGFYPSLHLNMARAHRDLGDAERARDHFRRAADRVTAAEQVADADGVTAADGGPYMQWVRYAAAQGLRSVDASPAGDVDAAVAPLVAAMCARADVQSLALLLPAQVGSLGTPADLARLQAVLHMLHASPDLPADERTAITDTLHAIEACG